MHLADAFNQSDLQCIQVTVSTFLSALAFPGNRTHDPSVANAMLYQLSYRKAIAGKFIFINYILFKSVQAQDLSCETHFEIGHWVTMEMVL